MVAAVTMGGDSFLLGRSSLKSGNYAVAEQLFARAAVEAPPTPELRAHLEFARWMRIGRPIQNGDRPRPGRWTLAKVQAGSVEIIEAVIESELEFVDGWVLRARIAQESGDTALAEELRARVEALDPTNQLAAALRTKPEEPGLVRRLSSWLAGPRQPDASAR